MGVNSPLPNTDQVLIWLRDLKRNKYSMNSALQKSYQLFVWHVEGLCKYFCSDFVIVLNFFVRLHGFIKCNTLQSQYLMTYSGSC